MADDTDSVPVGGGRAPKLPKVARVKNKAPATLQITAEQLLREAKERQLEIVPPPPKQKIQDADELADYQMRKRKEFEDNIRKNRMVMSNWFKYAKWEENQGQIQRARSVYERALDVEHRNISLWLKYSEMEMRSKQVNHARNLWDRAVTVLPRANQLWLKYSYMEETLGNIAGCRAIFERWMEWEPEDQYWLTYINFEMRYKELDRAREIFQRFVMCHPEVKNWIRWAKFEQKHHFLMKAREIYEKAVEFFGEEHMEEKLFLAFAQFEESQKEHDRARAIYRLALDRLPKDSCKELYKAYTSHEKRFGERMDIENVISKKRKLQYEEEINDNPMNYDAWFDYIRLIESEGNVDATREAFEKAVAQVPPSKDKQYWRRYIYLWINYAVFEELEVGDVQRTRDVYRTCLDLIPHKAFTFAKVWLLYAQFEIRQHNITEARKALGTALGKCPKAKLFRGYIDLEIQLREFHRCRILYEKFLLFDPENCSAWMRFAELETLLGDIDRARSVYELAINQSRLDMPEILWKSYIDFETELEEADKARDLYRRLLIKTQHIKVWLSLAKFELSMPHEDNVIQARHIYQEANNALKVSLVPEAKEHRVMLLDAWKMFEAEFGDAKSQVEVEKLMPKPVKKRRKMESHTDGMTVQDHGWEEYIDYIFPEDESAKPNLKLLSMAKMWKQQQQQKEESSQPEAEIQSPQETAPSHFDDDADDQDIVNESSSSSSDDDDDNDVETRPKKRKTSPI